MRFESIKAGVAIVHAADAQAIADAYLARKHGTLEAAPQAEKDAANAWVAGDRNYYELLKI